MRAVRWLWRNLVWVSVSLQYAITGYLAYLSSLPWSSELKVTLLALAVAFASSASADLKGMTERKKTNQILQKLDKIQADLNRRSKLSCIEAVAVVAGCIFETLRRRN
jgi:hypothetical protein